MSLSAAFLRSDRKAARILGDDDAPKRRTRSLVETLKTRFSRKRRPPPSFDDDEGEELLVWDVPNPFGPPDPELAHVHALIQREIDRVRRYEHLGPLGLPDADHVVDAEDSSNAEDDADDADDEHDDDTDEDSEIDVLPVSLRLIPSSSPSPTPTPSPPPPTPIATSSNEDSFDSDVDKHARRAKRDPHRSRAKAIAVLGPEASVVL